MSTPYTVRPGDYLVKIARDQGYPSWQLIYYHPDNTAFRRRRPNPDQIYPGDVLMLPDKGPGPPPPGPVPPPPGPPPLPPPPPPKSTHWGIRCLGGLTVGEKVIADNYDFIIWDMPKLQAANFHYTGTGTSGGPLPVGKTLPSSDFVQFDTPSGMELADFGSAASFSSTGFGDKTVNGLGISSTGRGPIEIVTGTTIGGGFSMTFGSLTMVGGVFDFDPVRKIPPNWL